MIFPLAVNLDLLSEDSVQWLLSLKPLLADDNVLLEIFRIGLSSWAFDIDSGWALAAVNLNINGNT